MSFSDGFVDASKIDVGYSENYIFDARKLVCQERSRGTNYLEESCVNTNSWNVHTGGTASIEAVNLGEGGTGNPAGVNVFQLSTGSTLNSYCAMSRVVAGIPKSYGLWNIIALTSVDFHTNNALNIAVQNTIDDKVMSILHYSGEILIEDNCGSYHSLSTHSPSYGCENWFENRDNDDGTNTVSLWQGTQLISCLTLTLPTGNPANSGLIQISQQSGGSANQTSQIQGINIGDTQLPDNALIQSVPYSLDFNAQAINVLFKVGDVCGDVVLGTDFTADLIIGGTSHAVSLCDLGNHGMGIIDYTKPVRFFWGSVAATIPQGTQVAYKAHMLNGKMMELLSVTFEAVSIY